MKKSMKGLVVVVLATFLVLGCVDRKPKQVADKDAASVEETNNDSTVYGVCGDGTAMHTLQIISDAGDTLMYMLNSDGDVISDVQGGLMVGDRLAIVGVQVNGERVAQKVINLTTLLGKWSSLDKNFEIQEGGGVQSFVKAESNPWTTWKILNGKLLLNKDTFSVNTLGADSLYLENNEGIFAYRRQQ